MRNPFFNTILKLIRCDPDVLVLTADNGFVNFDVFEELFPGRFINFGISEANMISYAAGMASCGKIPFAFAISAFITMRAYEQIRNDVCLQKQNVKIIGAFGGMNFSTLGPSHHAIEDIAIMRVLPGMNIICPASPLEAKGAFFAAKQIQGPVYIRLGSTQEPEIYSSNYSFEIGKGVLLEEGTDITLVATGPIVFDVLQAASDLRGKGISPRVISMPTIKPIDKELICKAANETGTIIAIEEHSIIGGLGSAIAEVLFEAKVNNVIFDKLGIRDHFPKGYGTHEDLKEINNISKDSIVKKVILTLKV